SWRRASRSGHGASLLTRSGSMPPRGGWYSPCRSTFPYSWPTVVLRLRGSGCGAAVGGTRPRGTLRIGSLGTLTSITFAMVVYLPLVADPETGLLVRTLAATGLRFGELAGLRWSAVDLERGVMEVREQYTHGTWSGLKTQNAKRSIPLPSALRDLLKARYKAL